MTEQPTRLDKQDARQGKSGLGVRNVLVWGTALVIVAFVVIFFIMKATSGT